MRLRDYRGVEDCEVEFSAEGVTVVEGPNEIGKTCIPQGLDLVLERLDSSRHRQVLSAQPVDRDAGPEVEVEMSSGQYRFVYRKRWLRSPETTLEIVEPRHEQLRGRKAHDRVEEILSETLDDKLWAALRVEQGTELAVPGFDVPSLMNALDLAAAGAAAADEDDDLWTRVRAEQEPYWTAHGRPRGDRTKRRTEVEDVRAQMEDLAKQMAALDGDLDELNRLQVEARQLDRTRDECDQRARDLEDQWAAAEKLRAEVDLRTAAEDAARARLGRADTDRTRRCELIDSVATTADQLSALHAQAEQAAPALAAAIHRAGLAASAAEKAREALRTAETVQRRADEDRDHHRRRIEVDQLGERYERVAEAEQRLKAADDRLASAKVDEELLQRIEQANIAVVQADSAVASVETIALRGLSVHINGEDVTLAAGDTRRIVVDDDAVLEVPDTVRVRVRPGTGARSLADERRDAHDELRRLCESGAVADVEQARIASEARKEAQRERADAVETKRRDLRDLTIDELHSKVERLTGRIASYSAERPEDPPPPPDYEEAKRIAAAQARSVDDLKQQHGARRQEAEAADAALQEQQKEKSKLSGRIEGARTASQEAERRLSDVRSQRSDDEIEAAVAESAQRLEDAQRSLEAAASELRAVDPESLEVRLRNARTSAERARDALQSNEEEQADRRFKLAVGGDQGLHTQLGETESRLRRMERDHERTEARAQAARLLHDTFLRRRQESRQRYVGPFKERIEQLGRIVFGSSFAVDVDDSLRVVRRTLDGDTLNVDQLSTGAREQIGVLCRLACAAIVSPDGGGAPVIIDDALGWSDADRLERMGAAIAAAGEQCQVIILTCAPGRYAHVGNAATIRLPRGS